MKPNLFCLCATVILSLSAIAGAATINIAFHNGGTTVNGMNPANVPLTQGALVNTATDTWNNVANNAGVGLSFSNFALSDSGGTASGATLASTAGVSTFNNNGWGSQNKDFVMMEGWYGLHEAESLTISGLSAAFTGSGYTVTIYGDSNVASRTMNYTIGGTTQTLVDGGIFTGTFDATNSTTFSGLNGASFSITGNPGVGAARSAINGIVIQSIPEPSCVILGLLAGATFLLRRRR